MAATLVVLLLISGVLLKFVYTPTPERAYDSILMFQETVLFGHLIRNIHHWSANLLVLTTFLHILRVFFTSAFGARRQLNWIVGLGLFGLILLANFTGYLLPWDQLAYWAVTVCAAALTYLPGIGAWLQATLIGGRELSAVTLANFFALHTAVIPAVLLLLLPFHFWCVRKAGGLAAADLSVGEGGSRQEKLAVIPHLLVREMAVMLSVVALVLFLAALWDAPLGAEANPGLSPNPTKAPWYFAGLQELLLHFHPFVAVTLIPVTVVAGLLALPFLPYGPIITGRWFGAQGSRRTVAAAALLALLLTPSAVLVHAKGMVLLAWLAPSLIIISVVVLYARRQDATLYDGVQAAFAFVATAFILLTITGVWFRGPSMALMWPWR